MKYKPVALEVRGVEKAELEVTTTHVLVPEDQLDKLRQLSRRTRVAQSEYLREAVDDLLKKYKSLVETEVPK
jgi:hypothetical protein